MEWIRCASIKNEQIYYVFMNKEDIQSQIREKLGRTTTIHYENNFYHLISIYYSHRSLGGGCHLINIDEFVAEILNSQRYSEELFTTILVKIELRGYIHTINISCIYLMMILL